MQFTASLCIPVVLLFGTTSASNLQVRASVDAGCPTGYGFMYPNATDPDQQNLQFRLGQHLQIQWRSPWPAVNLGFIGSNSDTFIFFNKGETKTSFGWDVNVNNSRNDNDDYYLYFENSKDNGQHCYSSLWSITNAAVIPNGPSQTIANPLPSTVPTTIPKPTQQINVATTIGASGLTTILITQPLETAAASAASIVPGKADARSVSTGLSDGAKAGIGVGVGLGVLLLAGIGIALFLLGKRRRPQTQTQNHQAYSRGNENVSAFTAAGGRLKEPTDRVHAHEADSTRISYPSTSGIPSYYKKTNPSSAIFEGEAPAYVTLQDLDATSQQKGSGPRTVYELENNERHRET